MKIWPDPPNAQALRQHMVETQLMPRYITDAKVLAAMRHIPRHLFAPFASMQDAYSDDAHQLACQQTISQPYIVALMTQELALQAHHKVLEIGTGSGYQTAILCELSPHIYSIERIPALAQTSKTLLNQLGYTPQLFTRDGTEGLPEEAPFDRILIAAAASSPPKSLLQQLSPAGGVMIYPLETSRTSQTLLKVTRTGPEQFDTAELADVRFVPLIEGNSPKKTYRR